MKRFYIRVSGYVQGVGFRYFIMKTAGLFSLTGWVRNLDNGDVDMEAQGSEADLEAFLERVQSGSRYAQVNDMEVKALDPIRESGFEIADW